MRSVLAVAAGLIGTAILVVITTPMSGRLLLRADAAGRRSPTPTFLFVTLILGGASAILGGWVAARLAPSNPFAHSLVLSLIILIAGVGSAIMRRERATAVQPRWFAWALPFVGACGAALGGWIARA